MAEVAGPERDLDLGEMPVEQRERAGRVPDVADVHALPGTAQQDARRTTRLIRGREHGGAGRTDGNGSGG